MASFTASPAPRRVYNASGSGSGSATPQRTVVNRGNGARAGSVRPSRLGTPASVARSTSAMDVDSEKLAPVKPVQNKPVTFAQSDELSAFMYAPLPIEVKQSVRNVDFFQEPWTGTIDPLSGYALAASMQTCFVWQHTQALSGNPTCYIFACPPSLQAPLHALLPSGSTREPGLILVSLQGELRFWESVASGLAGGSQFAATDLGLQPEEYLTALDRFDAHTLVVASSFGRLFRVAMISTAGRTLPHVHVFSRSQPSRTLSRFLPLTIPAWAGGGGGATGILEEDPQGILSLVTSDDAVFALCETRIVQWRISSEGSERLVSIDEVREVMSRQIRVTFPSAPRDDEAFDLEFLDMTLSEKNELLVLTSFAGAEETMSRSDDYPRRIYVLVRLSCPSNGAADMMSVSPAPRASVAPDEAGIEVLSVHPVPYISTRSSRAPSHPRLQNVPGGVAIAVHFGDAVAFCATGHENTYANFLSLKGDGDRVLGVGTASGEAEGEVLVLTAGTMLRVVLNGDKILSFDPKRGHAKLIKSTMVQSIMYGQQYLNPLRFSLPPEYDEDDLMIGAQNLSRTILESDPAIVPFRPDVSAQMKSRTELLAYLIHFINENEALPRVAQSSRQALLSDAEKLYAATYLWQDHERTGPKGNLVLRLAVDKFMEEAEDTSHDDILRAFFRLRTADLGKLLPYVTLVVREGVSEAPERLAEIIPLANRIALTMLVSAREYRAHNGSVYGLQLPMIHPWTSRSGVIDLVLELFNATADLLESPSNYNVDGEDRTPQPQGETPHAQLPQLAALLFAVLNEHLEYLASPMIGESTKTLGDRENLKARFDQLRPEVLDTLRRTGHGQHAFSLAEQYRDFQSLAALCNKDRVFPPNANPHAARITAYVERFQDAFAQELYQWYIDHGEVRTMFAHEQTLHGPYLDRFFDANPESELAWIHHLGTRRYAPAADAVQKLSTDAEELDEKHLMLSIGKLTELARRAEEPAVAPDDLVLNQFNHALDVVGVQQNLVDVLREGVNIPKRGKQSPELVAEAVMNAKATSVASRKSLGPVYQSLLRALMKGMALQVEDIVDLLTLKDNADPQDSEGFIQALELAEGAAAIPNVVPHERCETLIPTIWRRAYIHDHWDALDPEGVTDRVLMQQYRETMFYRVALAWRQQRGTPHMAADDAAAARIPSAEHVRARFPGLSRDEIEALVEEHRGEGRTLARYADTGVFVRVNMMLDEEAPV